MRERKLVAVLILVAVIALFLALVAGPIADGFAARDRQRMIMAQTFHANERRIAALDSLSHEAERQQAEMRTRFIAAPNADEANEALRERVEAVVEAGGAQVKSSEAVPGDDGWARVAVEARMGHAQLATVIARLNEQRPALAVDAVTVIADDALTNYKSDLLDVRLEAAAPFVVADAR